MTRVFSLAAALVAAIALAGWAQERILRPSFGGGRPLPRKAAPAPENDAAEEPNRQPGTAPIPPDAIGLPHEIAPQHALASVAEGQLKLVRFSFQNVAQNVVAKIEVDGVTRAESIYRTVYNGFAHTSWHDLNDIRAYSGDEELDRVQLADKLAKAVPVLIATKKVDPFYLDMYQAGTIQLILPASLIEQQQQGFYGYSAGNPMPAFYAPAGGGGQLQPPIGVPAQ